MVNSIHPGSRCRSKGRTLQYQRKALRQRRLRPRCRRETSSDRGEKGPETRVPNPCGGTRSRDDVQALSAPLFWKRICESAGLNAALFRDARGTKRLEEDLLPPMVFRRRWVEAGRATQPACHQQDWPDISPEEASELIHRRRCPAPRLSEMEARWKRAKGWQRQRKGKSRSEAPCLAGKASLCWRARR